MPCLPAVWDSCAQLITSAPWGKTQWTHDKARGFETHKGVDGALGQVFREAGETGSTERENVRFLPPLRRPVSGHGEEGGQSLFVRFPSSSPNRTPDPEARLRAYRHGFVPEEIDALVAVLLHVSQAVPLVPSVGEDVDADLASCGAGNTDAEGGRAGYGPA